MKSQPLLALIFTLLAVAILGRLASGWQARVPQTSQTLAVSPVPAAPSPSEASVAVTPTTPIPAGMGMVFGVVMDVTTPQFSEFDAPHPAGNRQFEVYRLVRRGGQPGKLLQHVMTDKSGNYELMLPPGHYLLRTESRPDVADNKPVEVTAGGRVRVNLEDTSIMGG